MQNPLLNLPLIADTYDIIITNSIDNIVKLKQAFEATSVLNFTYEIGTGNQLNFLDACARRYHPIVHSMLRLSETH